MAMPTVPSTPTDVDPQRDLVRDLRAALGDRVEDGARRRAEYSSDASNYRILPTAVAFPRDAADVVALREISTRHGIALTARGGGTSVAGNSIGPGVVMDFSRHMNRILEIDPDARTAVVEPGVVMGALQRAAAPHGLRFGPDPSTWARATIGGMIGNDACGSHSLSFGRTSDNVVSLSGIDGTGRPFAAGDDLAVVPGLPEFVARHLATLRTEFGRFGRQVSGYSLEHLLPERGHSLARTLVGTEGTCALLTDATVRLVPIPEQPTLVALGYASMYAAADAVPRVLAHHPGAVEGLGRELADMVRAARGPQAVPPMPRGAGWLLVELSGADAAETQRRADALVADSGAEDAAIYGPGAEQRAIWRIREDGAGLAGRTAAGAPAWPGIEDAAVPPERLGSYLRAFDAMLERRGLQGVPYGHFGDGCIHVRIDVPMEHDGTALRGLMEEAAEIIIEHDGSISGEHGDGRARGELLPRMYSPAALEAMAEFKGLFDPRSVLNPGIIVDPAPLDADLRRPSAAPTPFAGGLALLHDGGDLTRAVHRCVGVGKCRVPSPAAGTFMCPSFEATQDEKDSTRGRARVLQEAITGQAFGGAWRSDEVAQSLDLCLSCKACSSDCPAGVDMAAYKSEVLHRRYQGRLRPITHYLLGRLPTWARLAAPFAPVLNALLRPRFVQRIALALGGMDTRRSIPRFARRRFLRSRARRQQLEPTTSAPRGDLLLWVDSFSDCFSPEIATAAQELLTGLGYRVVLPESTACCGLTWITTGQLDQARARLSDLVDTLHPHAAQGRRILGLEPSCTATLRSDLQELLPEDPRAAEVARAVTTLAELFAADPDARAQLPRLDGTRVIAQPHCHHHAVMGFSPDELLLRELGAELDVLSGCCGLAGNFGMERGHYDVSVAVAERSLLPALRADPDAVLLADGFSCRTQADQLAGRRGRHLAELINAKVIRETQAP